MVMRSGRSLPLKRLDFPPRRLVSAAPSCHLAGFPTTVRTNTAEDYRMGCAGNANCFSAWARRRTSPDPLVPKGNSAYMGSQGEMLRIWLGKSVLSCTLTQYSIR